MTIDEAIKHCNEVAEKEEQFCVQDDRSCLFQKSHAECAADHRQLAEWLTELKELEAKHWDECRQIAHYDDELKEAERLVTQLKAKLCDSSEYCAYCDELDMSERDYFTCKYKKKKIPAVCCWQVLTPAHFDDIPWTKNEALKLIGGSENG